MIIEVATMRTLSTKRNPSGFMYDTGIFPADNDMCDYLIMINGEKIVESGYTGLFANEISVKRGKKQ